MRLFDIAELADVSVARDFVLTTLGFLSDPRPGMLTFVEDRKYLSMLARVKPGGVIAVPDLAGELDFVEGLGVSPRPRRAFFAIHNHLARHTSFYWQEFPTHIDPSARVHPTAVVAEKNVRIGPGTVIESNAVIAERTLVGANCLIKSGAVIGSVGFQVCRSGDDVMDLEHGGGVTIEDNVHVLANAVIASGVFDEPTTLGGGSRIGNLAFVSHNTRIGRRCIIGHNAVVNGNVVIGDDVWIGPGASLAHCIRIGARARVSLGSAVIGHVEEDQHVTGNVAIPHRRYLRHLAR